MYSNTSSSRRDRPALSLLLFLELELDLELLTGPTELVEELVESGSIVMTRVGFEGGLSSGVVELGERLTRGLGGSCLSFTGEGC